MKQRRFIAWMLMVVSIVMLTASVLPHHHHREILCLQHDVAACECTSHCTGHHHEHHQHAGHCSHGTHHACGSDCVTHFQTLTPEKASVDVSPDYSFCALLYTLADLLSIPLPLKDTRANLSYFYLEKLHSTCLWHVMGLRAPPSFVLWWMVTPKHGDNHVNGTSPCPPSQGEKYSLNNNNKITYLSWRKFSLWESWGCFS